MKNAPSVEAFECGKGALEPGRGKPSPAAGQEFVQSKRPKRQEEGARAAGHLLLLMTPGVTVTTWRNGGILDRELMPFRELVRRGWRVTLAETTETRRPSSQVDQINVVRIKPIDLVAPRECLAKTMERVTVVMSRQTSFSFAFLPLLRRQCLPFVLYGGYVQGEYLETVKGRTAKVRAYQALEAFAYHQADQCVVSTGHLKAWVQVRYAMEPREIEIVENFVPPLFFDVIRPESEGRRVVTVGRLDPVKRVPLLVDACKLAGVSDLTIVGAGQEQETIASRAAKVGLPVRFLGIVANERLPSILAQHDVFALASLREGHPKALAEAMAAGMPCVGTAVEGIRDLLRPGCGILAQASRESLGCAIATLLDDVVLARRVGSAARDEAGRRFALTEYVSRLENVLARHSCE